MKTTYTAKELMEVALVQIERIGRKQRERRKRNEAAGQRYKQLREGLKNAENFKRPLDV